MINFTEIANKQKNAVEKHKHLPLREFISNVLFESGFDVNRVDNVYIDEYVTYCPGVWGCLKKDGKYLTYFTNDRGELFTKEYSDPNDFINAFIINSTYYQKAEKKNNHRR